MSSKTDYTLELDLGEYYDDAKGLYDKYLDINEHIGVSRGDVFITCLYIVSRKERVPRRYSLFDDLTESIFSKLCSRVKDDLDIDTEPFRIIEWTPRVLDIARVKLDIDDFDSVASMVIDYAKKLEEDGDIYLEDWFNCPRIAVVSLVYICSLLNGERISQNDVSSVLDIKELTLRKYYKNILNLLGIEKKKIKNNMVGVPYGKQG